MLQVFDSSCFPELMVLGRHPLSNLGDHCKWFLSNTGIMNFSLTASVLDNKSMQIHWPDDWWGVGQSFITLQASASLIEVASTEVNESLKAWTRKSGKNGCSNIAVRVGNTVLTESHRKCSQNREFCLDIGGWLNLIKLTQLEYGLNSHQIAFDMRAPK